MIRPVNSNDRPLFISLCREFYSSGAVLHPVDPSCFERTFSELMRSNDYLEGCLLEHGGECAGYGLISKTYSPEAGGMVVWIEEIYIRKSFRSKGLGREFLERIEAGLGEDHRRIRLEVEPENKRAVSLYERLGYKKLGYEQMVKEL
jgi:ribosomal protein S18 acetylase RimI-like enzyme